MDSVTIVQVNGLTITIHVVNETTFVSVVKTDTPGSLIRARIEDGCLVSV